MRAVMAVVFLGALAWGGGAFAGLPEGDPYPDNVGQTLAKAHGVACDGVTDDGPAIQRALSTGVGNGRGLVQLPAGNCKVCTPASDSAGFGIVEWRGVGTQTGRDGLPYPRWGANHMQLIGVPGKTTLSVPANCPAFADAARPRAVLFMASKQDGGDDPDSRRIDGGGNKGFFHGIQDLSIRVESGNPGAVGIDLLASNVGFVRNVGFWANGTGYAAMRAERYAAGPMLLSNILMMDGRSTKRPLFPFCLKVAQPEYSLTVLGLDCRNASVAGVSSSQHALAMERYQYHQRAAAPARAIEHTSGLSQTVVVDGRFQTTGGALPAGAAMVGPGSFLARNTVAYAGPFGERLHDAAAPGARDYASQPFLNAGFPGTPTTPLGLPIERPSVPFHSQDPNDWANFRDYGGRDDNRGDQSPTIQAALDSGKRIVVVGGYAVQINAPLNVPCSVERLDFAGAALSHPQLAGQIRVAENCPRQLTIHNFRGKGVGIVFSSNRTLYLRDLLIGTGGGGVGIRQEATAGKLFLEDVLPGGGLYIAPGRKAWARQLNLEGTANPQPVVTNDGGKLWILGAKSEVTKPLIVTQNGGCTEVLGGLVYETGANVGGANTAMFRVVDSAFSAFMPTTSYNNAASFPVIIEETRNGEVRRLLRSTAQPKRGLGKHVAVRAGGACSF